MKTICFPIAAVLLLVVCASAQNTPAAEFTWGYPAQQAEPFPGPGPQIAQRIVIHPRDGEEARVGFFSAQLAGSAKPVTGAPYSATAVTEETQVLADGNRIVNKTSAAMARDSQGRTRREDDMGKVGPWAVNAPKLVFISDPVAHVDYVLETNDQIARVVRRGGKSQGIAIAGEKGLRTERRLMVQGGPPGGDVVFRTFTAGPGEPGDQGKTESLGTQTIEGISAEGKRTTRTIPAGQVGNERPLEIVSETWYSPELQMIVLSKRSDPRIGETTYKLTDLKRAEPDHSLFEIPAGYAVKEMPGPPIPPGPPMAP